MRIVTTFYEKKEDGNTICRRGLAEEASFLLDEIVVDGCRYGIGMLYPYDNHRKSKAIIFRQDSLHVWTIDIGDAGDPNSRTNVAQLGGINYFNEMVAMSGYLEIEYPENGSADFRIVEIDPRRTVRTIEEIIRDVFAQ